MQHLKIGDKVYWAGNKGLDPYVEVTVTAIELPIHQEQRNALRCDEIHWDEVKNCVVEIHSGKWAYGHQLKPLSNELEEIEFYEQD